MPNETSTQPSDVEIASLVLASQREAALRDILQVISRSRDDEQPVFDVILKNASRLCHAPMAALGLISEDGKNYEITAHLGAKPEFIDFIRENPPELDPTRYAAARAMVEKRTIHVDDLADPKLYGASDNVRTQSVALEGVRSAFYVPLIKDGQAIGAIFLYRRVVSPFSADDVALVETFAEQAVIAIENVRQFREVQTRLEREEASREILQVISASRTDPAPVFDVILRNAAQLSGAPLANLCLLDDARSHWHLVAHYGDDLRHLTVGKTTRLLDSELVPAVSMRTASIVHVEDLMETDLYRQGDPGRVTMVKVEGMRTILGVPLLLEDKAIGCITLFRRVVKAFTRDEIAFVEGFAAQAVIAIENVRQFREVQERLERERASAQILEVISLSRDDDKPVLDAIVANAARLTDAHLAGISLVNDARTHLAYAAVSGPYTEYFPEGTEFDLSGPLQVAVTVREARTVHTPDLADDPLYHEGDPVRRTVVDKVGIRTFLTVPLIKDGTAFGCLNLNRKDVRPFTPDEIQMVESFAAQAVIAIENVRQFREVQERLERERATGEVLQVISRSRDDEKPVFDAILRHAEILCKAPISALILAEPGDAAQTLAAHRGARPQAVKMFETGQMPMDAAQSYTAKCIVDGEVVAFRDMGESDLYQAGQPIIRSMVDDVGVRSVIFAPLIRDGRAIGAVTVYRKGVDPFDDTEIALLETFAAQAVIAIENVRQFRALETLNAELEDRVRDQVGEIERMGKLKRFLSPAVADAVVSVGEDGLLRSHRAFVATLFADIRGFTSFCETAEPEETIDVLQTYHEAMGELLREYGAGVDQRAGDGIMAIFNDPLPCEDPAGDAVRMALAMRARMGQLCTGWKRLGHRLGFGVGISLGYATVGMVGTEGRYDYTASGTAVNLAARLCDRADDGEILLSPRAYAAAEDIVLAESVGEVSFKGIQAALEVFRVVDLKSD